MRTGSGLVSLLTEDDIQGIISNRLMEAMTIGYSEKYRIDKMINSADVIACGPGLSQKNNNISMLKKLIVSSGCSMVLDADALNIIANEKKLVSYLEHRTIVTPHLGEMSRLTGKSIKYIEKNRMDVCKSFSEKYGIITVLKGYNTIISDGRSVFVNNTGNSSMASGGMGDCLTDRKSVV